MKKSIMNRLAKPINKNFLGIIERRKRAKACH
jgi:hypothetical protein